MIWFNGFPFLDNKEDHTFGVPVSQVMTSHLTLLPSASLELRHVEKIMTENIFQGYPIVEERGSRALVGYIGRTELRYAIDRAKREQVVSPHAKCYFTAGPDKANLGVQPVGPAISFDDMDVTRGQLAVDFSRYIDPTPITVHPRLPLETVMEVFKKMGPRVILVEYRGKLTGLVTVKDCLKFQFKAEAHDNPRDDSQFAGQQERLWGIIKIAAGWVANKITRATKGRVRLGEQDVGSHRSAPTIIEPSGLASNPTVARVDARGEDESVDGAAWEEDAMELEDHFPATGTGGG